MDIVLKTVTFHSWSRSPPLVCVVPVVHYVVHGCSGTGWKGRWASKTKRTLLSTTEPPATNYIISTLLNDFLHCIHGLIFFIITLISFNLIYMQRIIRRAHTKISCQTGPPPLGWWPQQQHYPSLTTATLQWWQASS